MLEALRHPEVREKNRLSMQERRAALKAKKRQWDPPKKRKTLGGGMPQLPRHSPSFDDNLVTDEMLNGSIHFRDPRGATTASTDDHPYYAQGRLQTESSEANAHAESTPPTPDEQVAIEVLAMMADYAPPPHISSSEDSIIRMANLLSSHELTACSESVDLPLASVKPGRTVQSALTLVAKLNEGPLTPVTPLDTSKWIRTNFGFRGHYLERCQWSCIESWRWHVEFSLHVWDNDTDT
ncbi:hypothetical protein B0H13DRAFT_1890152 [Mycena leptocephala]|nr:hypothetical protein B0H13DRAFT_1890152 [Mycena leptocephala]